MLKRKELRDTIINILRSDEALRNIVGDKIYNSKVTPFEIKNLPAINVVPQSQDASSRSINIPSFNCSFKINIEIYVSPETNWTDEADNIALLAENALFSNPEFTNLFSESSSYVAEYSLYSGGLSPIALEILSFSFSYFEEYPLTVSEELQKVRLNIDVIDPIASPCPGPDKRIEFKSNLSIS